MASKITTEQFIAFNEELVSLIRAGVPLELGLEAVRADQPAPLSRFSEQLIRRLRSGESLVEALDHERAILPHPYRALVLIGVRTGRLTDALESMVELAREDLELRRRMTIAVVYPVFVFMVAYVLFSWLGLTVADRMNSMVIDVFGGSSPSLIRTLVELRETLWYWVWIIPLVVLGLILFWMSSHQRLFTSLGSRFPWNLIPGLSRVEWNYRMGNFSFLMALLMEQETPLDEAIVLAAEVTGDIEFQLQVRRIAESLRSGNSPANALPSGLPPFLTWLLRQRSQSAEFPSELRIAAELYHEKASRTLGWVKTLAPVLAALIVGGGATLFYGIMIFLPLIQILQELVREPGTI